MIPISSASSSGAGYRGLTWTKGQHSRSFELKLNGEIVGRIERPSFWSSSYEVETADGRWTFRPSGCFGGAEIVDEASGQAIATMKPSWGTGGGTLTFADERKFEFTVNGWWRQVWSVTPEQGQPVLRLQAREKTVELCAGADVLKGRLSLLAMFAYYCVLQAEEAAAMAALAAAVS